MQVICWTGDGLADALRSVAVNDCLFLVPTHSMRKTVQECIRTAGGNASDYDIRIMAEWVSQAWAVLGDGTSIVSAGLRTPYLWRAFDVCEANGAIEHLRRSRGTMALVETIGRRALAWLPEEGSEEDAALPISPGERELVTVARIYGSLLASDNLVNAGTAYRRLPELLTAPSKSRPVGKSFRMPTAYALVGFEHLSHAQLALVSGLARIPGTKATMLLRAAECDLYESGRTPHPDGTWDVSITPVPDSHEMHVASRARHMLDALEALGTEVDIRPDCLGTSVSNPATSPVAALARALFAQDASEGVPSRSLVPPQDGSVSILQVAGQTAEPEAIAKCARDHACHGDVAIVAPDAYALWSELVPRLSAKRFADDGTELPAVAVRSTASVSLSSVRLMSVLMDASRQVMRLVTLLSPKEREALSLPPSATARPRRSAERALARHADEDTSAGWFLDMSREVLGDMSWWPPEATLDLMSEETVDVPTLLVARLRAEWASNRRLSAYDVLSTISDAEKVGKTMAELTGHIVNGHMGEALALVVRRLHVLSGSSASEGRNITVDAQVMRALSTSAANMLIGATKSLGDVTVDDPDSVERYFACVSQVMSHESVAGELLIEPVAPAGSAVPVVRIMSLSDMDDVPAGTFDTVMLVEQDSVASAVRRDDTPQNIILRKLGCLSDPESMSAYRAQFMTAVAAARSAVVFERAMRKVAGKRIAETFPSVGLMNVRLAYQEDLEGDIVTHTASEFPFIENLSVDGQVPATLRRVPVSPVGKSSPEGELMIWASRPTKDGDGERQVILTASDVDSYASCPYKWFVDRVLKVEETTTSIPAYAFGSFAHAVFEDVHRGMLSAAAERRLAEGDHTRYLMAIAGSDGTDGDDSRSKFPNGPLPDGFFGPLPGARVGGVGQIEVAEAETRFESRTKTRYADVLSGKYRVDMIPHRITDAAKADAMAQSIEGFADYERKMFFRQLPNGKKAYFVQRFTELPFGEEHGRPVTIAGVPFHGVIDRIDVNPLGEVLICDYKNTSAKDFDTKYCISLEDRQRLQLLVYAAAVRQMIPGARIAGLAYICTRSPYGVAGKLDNAVFDATDDRGIHLSALSRLLPKDERSITPDMPKTMDEFIDRGIELLEEIVRDMVRCEHGPIHHDETCRYCIAKGLCGVSPDDGKDNKEEHKA